MASFRVVTLIRRETRDEAESVELMLTILRLMTHRGSHERSAEGK